jgi:hypothetical protein
MFLLPQTDISSLTSQLSSPARKLLTCAIVAVSLIQVFSAAYVLCLIHYPIIPHHIFFSIAIWVPASFMWRCHLAVQIELLAQEYFKSCKTIEQEEDSDNNNINSDTGTDD